jgi:hypothetical protein
VITKGTAQPSEEQQHVIETGWVGDIYFECLTQSAAATLDTRYCGVFKPAPLAFLEPVNECRIDL